MTDRADIQKRLDEARSEISHLQDMIEEANTFFLQPILIKGKQ
jgi:hypothetical protein